MSAQRLHTVCAVVAATGALLCAALIALDWVSFLRAWLVAVAVWIALPQGAMAILMTHNLSGGDWGEPCRPALKAALTTLPLLFVAFLPLIAGVEQLFAWTAPLQELEPAVRHKRFYLNLPFFYLRLALFIAAWWWLAARLGAWRADDVRPRRASAGGLVLWLLTVTFFTFDWLMSLEPTWYSDIYGLLWISSALIATVGLLSISVLATTRVDERLRSQLQDLAGLWLTVIVAWLFIGYSQYIVIWSTDLPHEIEWYLKRGTHGWQWLGLAVLLLFAVLPFCALLLARVRRSPQALCWLGLVVLVAHLLHTVRLILPAFSPQAAQALAMSPVTIATLGALWLLRYQWQYQRLSMTSFPDTSTEARSHG